MKRGKKEGGAVPTHLTLGMRSTYFGLAPMHLNLESDLEDKFYIGNILATPLPLPPP